jgi:hypothetical protein
MSTSLISSTPFWGRAYELDIITQDGQTIVVSADAWEPEALRFTFECEQIAFGEGNAFWLATVEIYNCDGNITSGPSAGVNLAKLVVSEGDNVVVKAGYQAQGKPQTIWQGEVYQPTWERVDVVDYKLTLHCVLGRAFGNQNFINQTLTSLSTGRQQAEWIVANSTNQFNTVGSQLTAFDAANSTKLPRGKSFFGDPNHYLSALARANGMVAWIGLATPGSAGVGSTSAPQGQWNVAPLYNPSDPASSATSNGQVPGGQDYPVTVGAVVATYASTSIYSGPPINTPDGTTLSMIGTPQQTQYGVDFRVLLDARLKIDVPLPQVRLSGAYVRQAARAFPAGPLDIRPLPSDGLYAMLKVRHCGDTRGNDWYTEVTGYSSILDIIALLGH